MVGSAECPPSEALWQRRRRAFVYLETLMVQKVIYFHGYGSNGNTDTAKNLRSALGADFDVVSPSYNGSLPAEAARALQCVCLRDTAAHPILVGTSLGGFFANYFSRTLGLPAVIINPSLTPSVSLKKYGEHPDVSNAYAALEAAERRCTTRPARIVILGMQDEVLDHAKNGLLLKDVAQIVQIPMGHRVDAAQIGVVADAVRSLTHHVAE